MKYSKWTEDHFNKVEKIFKNLENKSALECEEYFRYENMIMAEHEFCPLYRKYTKCHKTEKLNCMLCGCPYFKYFEDPIEKDGIFIASICTLESKNAGIYMSGNIQHCDCSGCIVPHSSSFIKNQIKINNIEDSCSLLEMIRGYQLGSILGKYKLF